jgi:predicted methyltransferase
MYEHILADRRKFIARLKFEDMSANVRSFDQPFSEQIALINALRDSAVKTVVVLKPRQIGISTANCADTFYEAFAAKKPLRTLIAADHSKTTKSLFGKFCTFYVL